MNILAIETSCDETACAVIRGNSPSLPVGVLSSIVASSQEIHVKTGGIVPEVASREQVKSIVPVIRQALAEARISKSEIRNKIDAVAVTVGPGLVGSLLVGVETAKALAYAWSKPIMPVNHLIAHLYANWVEQKGEIPRLSGSSHLARSARDDNPALKSLAVLSNSKTAIPEFPAIGLVVSGGHTDLVLMEEHPTSRKASSGHSGKLKWLGGTRDDAAGECFDKCARLLGLGHPGGPAIEKASQKILNSKSETLNKYEIQNTKYKILLPRPLIHEDTYDFSFSGLKTAVAREVKNYELGIRNYGNKQQFVSEIAHELQEAIVEVLVSKLMKAVGAYKPKSLILGGGVAANSRLRRELKLKIENGKLKIAVYIPPIELCTDNAVAIGAAAYYMGSPTDALTASRRLPFRPFREPNALAGRPTSWQKVVVDPGLEII